MPSQILRPDANQGSPFWDEYEYTYIDDAVTAPTTPTGGTNEQAETNGVQTPQEQEWSVDDITSVAGESLNWVRVYFYESITGSAAVNNIDVEVDNVWQGAKSSFTTAGGGWKYAHWSVSNSINSGLTNMAFSIENATQGAGDQLAIYAAYVEANYGTPPGSPWYYYAQQGSL
jgi:hypothetical protein